MKEDLEKLRKNRRQPTFDKEEEAFKKQINQMKKAQIILYAILNLHDKAVKLALECEDI